MVGEVMKVYDEFQPMGVEPNAFRNQIRC